MRCLLLSAALLSSLCLVACREQTPEEAATTAKATGALPAKQGLSATGEAKPSPEDRCPICGMAPIEHPKTAGALILDDGRTFYTCGHGCTLRTRQHPEVFLGVDKAHLANVMVPTFFTGRLIPADQAFWVAGSDVAGPMGKAVVPLSTQEEVEAFRARHGGNPPFNTADLKDDQRFTELTGKPALKPGEGVK